MVNPNTVWDLLEIETKRNQKRKLHGLMLLQEIAEVEAEADAEKQQLECRCNAAEVQ
jgi:hypothetical protein